jgi:multicomponent Na+:H+ antiporter subunit C
VIGTAAITVGVLLAVSVYLLLSRSLQRVAIGFLLLSNGINLFVLTAGGLRPGASPPIVSESSAPLADPLPHAFLLTAIVIGLAAAAFLLALIVRTHAETDAGETAPGGDGR